MVGNKIKNTKAKKSRAKVRSVANLLVWTVQAHQKKKKDRKNLTSNDDGMDNETRVFIIIIIKVHSTATDFNLDTTIISYAFYNIRNGKNNDNAIYNIYPFDGLTKS